MLVVKKFGGLASKTLYSNIGGIYKFGSLLTMFHRCQCIESIFVELNLAVWRRKRNTKPPNLIPRQIFWTS